MPVSSLFAACKYCAKVAVELEQVHVESISLRMLCFAQRKVTADFKIGLITLYILFNQARASLWCVRQRGECLQRLHRLCRRLDRRWSCGRVLLVLGVDAFLNTGVDLRGRELAVEMGYIGMSDYHRVRSNVTNLDPWPN